MHIYVNITIYLPRFSYIFSVCYTPSSGRVTRISAQSPMFLYNYRNTKNKLLQTKTLIWLPNLQITNIIKICGFEQKYK